MLGAHMKTWLAIALCLAFIFNFSLQAFEGRITAAVTQGGQTTAFRYTISTSALRLEATGSDRPNPVDALDLRTGTLALFSPHNRSFVYLKPALEIPAAPPGIPAMHAGIPSGVGLQTQAAPAAPASIGPTSLPGMTATPAMPAMPQVPAGM